MDADLTLLHVLENPAVARNVTKAMLRAYMSAICANGGHKVAHLKLLRMLIKPEGQVSKAGQTMAMEALRSLPDDYLLLRSTGGALLSHLVAMATNPATANIDDDPNSTNRLAFHVELISLLAACTEGINPTTTVRAQGLLSLEDIAKVGC